MSTCLLQLRAAQLHSRLNGKIHGIHRAHYSREWETSRSTRASDRKVRRKCNRSAETNSSPLPWCEWWRRLRSNARRVSRWHAHADCTFAAFQNPGYPQFSERLQTKKMERTLREKQFIKTNKAKMGFWAEFLEAKIVISVNNIPVITHIHLCVASDRNVTRFCALQRWACINTAQHSTGGLTWVTGGCKEEKSQRGGPVWPQLDPTPHH